MKTEVHKEVTIQLENKTEINRLRYALRESIQVLDKEVAEYKVLENPHTIEYYQDIRDFVLCLKDKLDQILK